MGPIKYSHALVCRLSSSYKGLTEGIDYDKARLQHEAYVRTLRDLGLDVVELPPDEALPHCVYIEDTAVVCNGTALISKPKDENRIKEVSNVY